MSEPKFNINDNILWKDEKYTIISIDEKEYEIKNQETDKTQKVSIETINNQASKTPDDVEPYTNDSKMGPNATTLAQATTGLGRTFDEYGKPKTFDQYTNRLNKMGPGSGSMGLGSGSINTSELDPENLSMNDETKISFKRLFKSYYNLALIFGTIGVRNIVNYIAKIALNTDDISEIDNDEAIVNLKEKLGKLETIVKDPQSKEAFGKASAAIGELASIFIEEAQGPLMQVGEKAILIGLHTFTIGFEQTMKTMEDSIKLIPIFGEGYMIVENIIDISQSASSVSQGVMRYYSDIMNAYTEISDKMGLNPQVGESKAQFGDAMKDIAKIINDSMKQATEYNEGKTGEYARVVEQDPDADKLNKKNLKKENKQEGGKKLSMFGGRNKTLRRYP